MTRPNCHALAATMHAARKRSKRRRLPRYWLATLVFVGLVYAAYTGDLTRGLLWIASGTKAVEMALREGS